MHITWALQMPVVIVVSSFFCVSRRKGYPHLEYVAHAGGLGIVNVSESKLAQGDTAKHINDSVEDEPKS